MRSKLPVLMFLLSACVTGKDPPKPTDLVEISGGEFLFGNPEPCFNLTQTVVTCKLENTGMPKTYPPVLVNLEPFAIEEHEVTNEQYEYCVAMGACPEPVATNVGNVADYYFNPAYRKAPVVNVTIKHADAYCRFIGRRLPTEAEWERAAAGPATQLEAKRRYPFADGLMDLTDCKAGKLDVKIGACQSLATPVDVKSSADDYVLENGKKIYDLGGNVAELVQGAYYEDITCKSGLPEGCRDCFSCSVSDSECKQNCWTEPSCPCVTGKLPDNTSITCFKECEKETPPGIPICIPYPPTAQDASVLYREMGNMAMARGGSYYDQAKDSCRASTTDRTGNTRHGAAIAFSNFFIGFRCVADITCIDGIDNDGNGYTDSEDPACIDGKPGGE